MNTEEYWFWLCNIEDIYQSDIKLLLNYFGSAENVFSGDVFEMVRKGMISEEKGNAVKRSRETLECFNVFEKMQKSEIDFIFYGSPSYPKKFYFIENPPYSLYVKGRLPSENFPSVGMVGARKCSAYGSEKAIMFASSLAAEDIQIISGMAAGIDSCSAMGAIGAGGRTFAVLGCGVDVIYPKENIDLYYRIIMTGGGIISEYPLGTRPFAWQFPHRNRLISGFSDKLLVIEAKKQSGTLITAGYAAEQGKDVYAMPGRPDDILSEGCNRLISDGAGVLLNAEDIIKEVWAMGAYKDMKKLKKLEKRGTGSSAGSCGAGGSFAETGGKSSDHRRNSTETKEKENIPPEPQKRGNPVNDDSKNIIRSESEMHENFAKQFSEKDSPAGAVYRLLSAEPKDVQDIISESGFDAVIVSRSLTELELEGLAAEVSKDKFVRSSGSRF